MRRFEFNEGTSNKFWEVDVKGNTLTVTFGRIETKGQSKTKDFSTPEKATAEMEKLILEKTNKGYKELAIGGNLSKAKGKVAAKKVTKTTSVKKNKTSNISPEMVGMVHDDFESLEKWCLDTAVWLDDNISRFKIWHQAAQRNNPKALLLLGLCHDFGKEVAKDKKKAVRFYRLAAMQGNARAQLYLGVCYDKGEGVKEDKKEAVRLYLLAAEQGDARAQLYLAISYDRGAGVKEDKKGAVRLYLLAAEQGNARAQFNLAISY